MLPLFRSGAMYRETMVALLSFQKDAEKISSEALLRGARKPPHRAWDEKNPAALARPCGRCRQPQAGGPSGRRRGKIAAMPLLSDAELLARLVAFDSTSRNSNLPIADFLCDYLDRPGVRIARNPSADGTKTNVSPGWAPEPTGDRRGLVLSGHMDVVPADEEGWRSDPFALADAGDRWVGRGACDMKGFLALARQPRRRGSIPDAGAPRWRSSSPTTRRWAPSGAKRLTESFPAAAPLPRSAIIGEPTSLRVARTHKGHLKLRVTLHGVSRPQRLSAPGAQRHRARRPGDRGPRRAPPGARSRGGCPTASCSPRSPSSAQRRHASTAARRSTWCRTAASSRWASGRCRGSTSERAGRAGRAAAVRAAAAPFEPEIELLSDSPPLLLDEGAPIHRHLCAPGRPGRRSRASPSPPTPAGCSAWGWTAPSSAPARSRWPTSRTSTCPRPNSPPPAASWRGRSERFCEEGRMMAPDPRSRPHLDRRAASNRASRSPSDDDGRIDEPSGALGRTPDRAPRPAAPSCPAW